MRLRPPRTPKPEGLITHHIVIEGQPTFKGPTRNVLLLEDRNDFQEVLRDYLVSCSFKVKSVSSGIEGLREIMKRRFDLILCDMMMPRMGGEMFYWAVTRTRPATRQRFIFFYRPQEQSVDRVFLSAGARDGALQTVQAVHARLSDPRYIS